MVTMIDCISRVSKITKQIADSSEVTTKPMLDYLREDINSLDEIVICAAGSSYTATTTAFQFMEKVTGLQVHPYMANQFNKKAVYNPNALYIFVSQTGTSSLVKEMLIRVRDKGYKTVAITEKDSTPLAKEAGVHVDMGCGYEEYLYRTIGYVSSFVTLMVIGLTIGLKLGKITKEEYDAYLDDARKAADNHPNVVKKSLEWFEKNKENLIKAKSFIVYGAGPLYGVSLEGALKILEITKHFLSIGYEAEDGLHGPCLGYNKGDVVIALNDGINDEWMAKGVVEFSKKELGQGYIFGANPMDESDLGFEVVSDAFRAVEFAPTVEILAYELAVAINTPVDDAEHSVDHVSSKYFETHRG